MDDSKMIHSIKEDSKKMHSTICNSKAIQSAKDDSKMIYSAKNDSKVVNLTQDDSKVINLTQDDSKVINLTQDDSEVINLTLDDSKVVNLTQDDSKVVNLTQDDSKVINLTQDDSNTIHSTKDNSKAIHSTMNSSWYNSTFIEKYMDILVTSNNKVFYFNTSFLHKYIKTGIPGIRRWIKEDILQKKMLFFPVHVDKNHWILIAIDISNKCICHYNSYGYYYKNPTNVVVDFIKNWEIERGQTPSNYEIVDSPTPRQTNTYDSGPWILQIAKCLVFNLPINFSQSDIILIRYIQTNEVYTKSIKIFTKNALNRIRKTFNRAAMFKRGMLLKKLALRKKFEEKQKQNCENCENTNDKDCPIVVLD